MFSFPNDSIPHTSEPSQTYLRLFFSLKLLTEIRLKQFSLCFTKNIKNYAVKCDVKMQFVQQGKTTSLREDPNKVGREQRLVFRDSW